MAKTEGLSPALRLAAHGLQEHGWRVNGPDGKRFGASILGRGGRACGRCRAYDAPLQRCPSCPPAPARRCEACRAAYPPPPRRCEHTNKGWAEWSGVSRETTRRAERALITLHLIFTERRGGRGLANRYWDPDFAPAHVVEQNQQRPEPAAGQPRRFRDLLPPEAPRGP